MNNYIEINHQVCGGKPVIRGTSVLTFSNRSKCLLPNTKITLDIKMKSDILFVRRKGMLAKLTAKNQITLPRDVVKVFKGIEYFDAVVQDGRIVLEPVTIRPVNADLSGIRKKIEKLGVLDQDVVEAIRWSRQNLD